MPEALALLLDFFSDLILFTFGLVVSGIWIIIVVAILVEGYDAAKSIFSKDEPDDEEEYNDV